MKVKTKHIYVQMKTEHICVQNISGIKKNICYAYNFTHQKFMVGTSHNFKRQNSN